MAKVIEPAFPSKRIPGSGGMKHNSGQSMPSRSSSPASEPAFKAGSNSGSRNKAAVRSEPAFRTRGGGAGNSM